MHFPGSNTTGEAKNASRFSILADLGCVFPDPTPLARQKMHPYLAFWLIRDAFSGSSLAGKAEFPARQHRFRNKQERTMMHKADESDGFFDAGRPVKVNR